MISNSTSDAHSQDNIPFFERLLFTNRPLWIALFALLTVYFGFNMLQLRPEASFLRMIPTYHPYIQNYITHKEDLKGLGNVVRICVESTDKDIFTADYFETLKNMTDEVFFIPGVHRSALKSLWTPVTRWIEVTEEGFAGGPVIPASYDGSEMALNQLRTNVFKSGEIGTLVANDLKSSIITVALNEIDPETGVQLDYQRFSEQLEEIRSRFQSHNIKIHITGFAKVAGDLIDGLTRMLLFFSITVITLLVIFLYYSRCLRSTLMRMVSSLVAVTWLLGILRVCGYGLNPYSMLVPFLIFALGTSHGIQMFNGIAHEIAGGADKYTAARLAFRRNSRPGLIALGTDCIGFASLLIIRIGVIQEIAVAAAIGVVIVACTELILLPLQMSYLGIRPGAVENLKIREARSDHPVWKILSNFTHRKWAGVAITLAVLALVAGSYLRQDLKVGDLDPGAPELRPTSRYNIDNEYLNTHYSTGSDIFIVMLKTEPAGNSTYPVVVATDQLQWRLLQLKGVQNVISHVDYLKRLNSAFMEGNPKWLAVPRSRAALDNMVLKIPANVVQQHGRLTPILIYLEDHKAETLQRVVATVEEFSGKNNTESYQFLMAAGNAGIEAATNIEVEKAILLLTLLVYTFVFGMCLLTFKSFRSALCVVSPLLLTSVLCELLMAQADIGVKVATLPVIAVGVGIGVDYGIYIFYKLQYFQNKGYQLSQAYYRTLNTTGWAVSFTGLTLAAGVATWIFSPIKFQADMGFLLTFMFLWNMVGAMILLPALARFMLPSR